MLFVPRNIAGKLTTQGQRTPRELTRHDTQQEMPTVFSTSPNIKVIKTLTKEAVKLQTWRTSCSTGLERIGGN
jgi:hypothetical protein